MKHYNIEISDADSKQEIIEDLVHNHECVLMDECKYLPKHFALYIPDHKLEELKSFVHIAYNDLHYHATSCDLGNGYSLTSRFSTHTKDIIDNNPQSISNIIHYYFTRQMDPGSDASGAFNIGRFTRNVFNLPSFDRFFSDQFTYVDGTYRSYWLGRDVDFIALEVDDAGKFDAYHPDFYDPETGEDRFIPTDWQDGKGAQTMEGVLTSHARGVLSQIGGINSGLAKKARMRVMYLGNFNVNFNFIANFHLNKSLVNGQRTPTIATHAWGFHNSYTQIAVPISIITKLTYVTNDATQTIKVVNRPTSGSWNNNYSEFIAAGLTVCRVKTTSTTWRWCVVFGDGTWGGESLVSSTADLGVLHIFSAGNSNGTAAAYNSFRANTTSILCSSTESYTLGGITSTWTAPVRRTTGLVSTYYPLRPYGPASHDKAITVAAAQTSENYKVLDPYSCRGPHIDVAGFGWNTWSSAPYTSYGVGNDWGMFGGTSSAAPNVAGLIGCLAEKHYYYTGRWPTPKQMKELMIRECRTRSYTLNSGILTDYGDVPDWTAAPSSAATKTYLEYYTEFGTGVLESLRMESGQGTIYGTELRGTPNRLATIDCNVIKNQPILSSRPGSGQAYPRPKFTTRAAPPTYGLRINKTSVNEGDTVTFTLDTTGLPSGTIVPYTITGVQESDISGVS